MQFYILDTNLGVICKERVLITGMWLRSPPGEHVERMQEGLDQP